MATDAERDYADEVGRHFSRQYGMPPMTGRVAGWLLICDPPEQTAAEIAEHLQASRSAVGNAVDMLDKFAMVRRRRVPGERADRIAYNPTAAEAGLDASPEFSAMRALALQGLALLEGESEARRARLLGTVAFYDFLLERMPALAEEWRALREKMQADGDLPA
jgi:DNA-binding MarR family transcriptional regulator